MVIAMIATLMVHLSDSYKAVVDAAMDRLFKMTGTKDQAVWFSAEKYEFKLYSGEELGSDPALGPVLAAARGKGYAAKRKTDNELRQEIVLVLKDAITVNDQTANAWYVQKNQASTKWTVLGTFPVYEPGKAPQTRDLGQPAEMAVDPPVPYP